MRYPTFLHFAWLPLVLATMLSAQRDPREEIKEIARSIDEQLQEIDKLLLESSKKNQARTTPKDLLQKAHEKSTAVEGGIDQLIEKLNEMKQQGQSSQSDQQQQQQQQDSGQPRPDQGQQQQQNRRENQTPDFVKQPPQQGEQPGEPQQGKPEPQPGNAQPRGGQEAPSPGENTKGNRQLEPELGPPNPGQGSETWGELQPYLNSLKNRGSAPTKVPEQYRKYWEAYLRQKQQKPGGK